MMKSIPLIIILIIVQISLSLTESTCKEGYKNCAKCHPITKLCVKCDKNIYSLNKNGECEPSKKCNLGENYCLECSEEGTICQNCDEGYYPDENGGCSYSENCQISYQGKCLKCKKDYILHSDVGVCKSSNSEDFKNCKKVNSNTGLCQECEEDYYLNDDDKRCTNTKNCTQSSFGVCTK